MTTGSLPGDNMPTKRTEESAPEVLEGGPTEWAEYDDDGNPINGS